MMMRASMLFQINYLHTGAPKVWYCVPPSESDKFNEMAKQLFPEAASSCAEFMRHKDIMISPSLLKTYNIKYVQALQKPGEFIVLNASAYHAGFNLGFNCAEAVNFAIPDWLEIGRDCAQCECGLLSDGVSLDMSIFFPGLYDTTSSDESSCEDDSSSDTSEMGSSSCDSAAESEHESSDAETEDEKVEKCVDDAKKRRGRPLGSKNKAGRNSNAPRPAGRLSLRDSTNFLRLGSPTLSDKVLKEIEKLPREACHVTWGRVAEAKPVALVTKDDSSDSGRAFTLVHRLERPASRPDSAWFGILEKDCDGLYCPRGDSILVQSGPSALPKISAVRTEWTCPENRRRGGWKLLSKEARITM